MDSTTGGLEGEYYLERLTLTAGLGVGHIEYDDPAPFIDTSVTRFYATAGLRYYPLDDLMVAATFLHAFDNALVVGQIEYGTPLRGLSVFAELAAGEHDYDHALIGAQFYFGKTKSLIRRHREDDPPNIVRQILHGIGIYGAEFNTRGKNYAESQGTQYTGNYGLVSRAYGSVVDTVVASPDLNSVVVVPAP